MKYHAAPPCSCGEERRRHGREGAARALLLPFGLRAARPRGPSAKFGASVIAGGAAGRGRARHARGAGGRRADEEEAPPRRPATGCSRPAEERRRASLPRACLAERRRRRSGPARAASSAYWSDRRPAGIGARALTDAGRARTTAGGRPRLPRPRRGGASSPRCRRTVHRQESSSRARMRAVAALREERLELAAAGRAGAFAEVGRRLEDRRLGVGGASSARPWARRRRRAWLRPRSAARRSACATASGSRRGVGAGFRGAAPSTSVSTDERAIDVVGASASRRARSARARGAWAFMPVVERGAAEGARELSDARAADEGDRLRRAGRARRRRGGAARSERIGADGRRGRARLRAVPSAPEPVAGGGRARLRRPSPSGSEPASADALRGGAAPSGEAAHRRAAGARGLRGARRPQDRATRRRCWTGGAQPSRWRAPAWRARRIARGAPSRRGSCQGWAGSPP